MPVRLLRHEKQAPQVDHRTQIGDESIRLDGTELRGRNSRQRGATIDVGETKTQLGETRTDLASTISELGAVES